ncbi:MAG: endolytic transglycosylase MltG [Clostridia bacterium]
MADKNYHQHREGDSDRRSVYGAYDDLRSQVGTSEPEVFSGEGVKKPSDTIQFQPQKRRKAPVPAYGGAQGSGSKRRKRPVSGAQRELRKRIAIASALLGVFFTVLLSVYAIFCVQDVLAIGVSEESVRVEIPENATTSQIIDILEDNGLVKNGLFCKLFAQFRGYENNYVGGVYTVDSNIGVEGMLYLFKEKPQSAAEVQVTIPEGWTVDQIVTRLSEMGVCSADSLYDTLENTDYSSYPFIAALQEGDINGRYYLLEGYLFPDTYMFYVDSNPNDVVKKMLDNYESKISDINADGTPDLEQSSARAQELGCTWDEIMVIASIIEREAGSADQMADISAVIHNRLKNSVEFPLLQMDSTSDYYYNYIEPKLEDDAQKQLYESSYNTYQSCLGLPKGPICNPSLGAIYAALYPTEGSDYYYFCHDREGNIYLARTDQEHEQNKAKANLAS